MDLWSLLGLRFQGFQLAAALGIFDGAASWSSHEPGLVAVAAPGYSSMTGGGKYFHFHLSRWNDRMRATVGSAAGGGDDNDASSPKNEGASEELSVFPAPERVTTFTVQRSGWVVGLGSEKKMVPG